MADTKKKAGKATKAPAAPKKDAPVAKKVETKKKAVAVISHDEIAERAHKLFLARGGQGGDPLNDWLTAERQLQAERGA